MTNPFRVITQMLAALAASALLAPAQAQTPMSVQEFEAYVTGRTLPFGVDGIPYGIEEFRPGRRVVWAFIGEECRKGRWFPRDEQICFVYDDAPAIEHCWIFWRGEGGLNARFMGEDPVTELYEVENSPQPLFCPGPQIGA